MEHPCITDQTELFIRQHLYDDPYKLMLSARKKANMDMKMIAQQIMARRKIKEKLPLWFQTPGLFYPSKLSTEQCSSEITAHHKQQLVKGNSVCDLTGGLGVDCYFYSLTTARVTYVEREPLYCEAARNNFTCLNCNNIEIINDDARLAWGRVEADTFYLDPARRGESDKRLYALDECEPNILEIKESLLKKSLRVIVKISPMVDIHQALLQLPETVELHIVSVKNECKELLLVLEKEKQPGSEVVVKCFNYLSPDCCETFEFIPSADTLAKPLYTDQISGYLYEPNASIQKAGCYKSVSQKFRVAELDVNSHLFVSDELIEQFPGRIFTIKETFLFNSSAIKTIKTKYKKANVSTRNFPLSSEKLRNRLGVLDGGDLFIFGTTLNTNNYSIIIGHKYTFG